MRRELAACFVVGWLAGACTVTTTTAPPDGGPDGTSGDGAIEDAGEAGPSEADAACVWMYHQAGCDAAPVCVDPMMDACAFTFCGCDNKSFVNGCGYSDKPFASWGLCDGDVDGVGE